MKRGLDVFTPMQVAAMRITIACLCLLPFIWNKISKIPVKYWKFLVLAGFLGSGIPAILFTTAETRISSSLAGILNSLTPVFTLIFAMLVFKTRVTGAQATGIIIGFTGAVMLIIFNGKELNLTSDILYSAMVVLATILYAINVNIIRNFLFEIESIVISGAALIVPAIVYASYLTTTDVVARFQGVGPVLQSFLSIVALAVFGTALSIYFFNKLLKATSVLFAASTTYFIPVFAILWGYADSEAMGWHYLIGLIFILAGTYLITKNKGA